MAVIVAVTALALVFDLSNGFHDSAIVISALVATHAARPAAAIALAGIGNVLGPILFGTAVANAVAGVVHVRRGATPRIIGAALVAALAWNLLTWWRGLPSSSSHAVIGGLAGAAFAEGGGAALRWGGVEGFRLAGLTGVLLSLALSPVAGFVVGAAVAWTMRRVLRRARRGINEPIRRIEWFTAGVLAMSHGANDAQKSMGLIALLLVASGHLHAFFVPIWVRLACAGALTAGTTLGGWRIVKTLGSGIVRLKPIDGLASQSSSSAVILASALLGGPVSTTHVVAASVVGVGAVRGHRRVRWSIVGEMATAWLVTLPVCAALAAGLVVLARFVP